MIDLPLLRYLADQLITSRLKLLQLPLPVLCSDQWSLVSCTLLVLMLVSLKVIKQVPVLLRHHQSRYALWNAQPRLMMFLFCMAADCKLCLGSLVLLNKCLDHSAAQSAASAGLVHPMMSMAILLLTEILWGTLWTSDFSGWLQAARRCHAHIGTRLCVLRLRTYHYRSIVRSSIGCVSVEHVPAPCSILCVGHH